MKIYNINSQREDALIGVEANEDDLENFVDLVFSKKLPSSHFRHKVFVIKPNLGFMTDSRGGTTSVQLLEIVLKKIVSEYNPSDILITESDGIAFRCEDVFDYLDLYNLVEKYRAKLLNLSKSPYTIRRFQNNLILRDFFYPDCLHNNNTVLINLAKVKTHEISRYSGAIKNLFGLNPFIFKLKYHKNIDQVLTDIYHIFPSSLTIVEGLWAINGHGPWTGTPMFTGFLVGCTDSLIADLIVLKQIGLDVEKIPYLNYLSKKYKTKLPDCCQYTSSKVQFQWVEASKISRLKERAACAIIPFLKLGLPLVFPSKGTWKIVWYGKGGSYCHSIHQYGKYRKKESL